MGYRKSFRRKGVNTPPPSKVGWIRTNAAVIIAMCSLTVAVTGLYFSVKAQDIDREYKELSIRPFLSVATNGREAFMVVRNEGLGPAHIKSAMFSIGDRKLQFFGDSPDKDNWIEEYYNFFYALFNETDKDIESEARKYRKRINFNAAKPIQVKEMRYIFSLINTNNLKDGTVFDENKSQLFLNAMRKINYKICYCSITGKFCELIIKEDKYPLNRKNLNSCNNIE